MNESYRKMNSTLRTNREEEWIGGNGGGFSIKQQATTGNNNKEWMGQVHDNKHKIVESKLQTPKHTQQPMTKTQLTHYPTQQKATIQSYKPNKQTPVSRFINNPAQSRQSQVSSPQKSPMQLMNDIFRSIGMQHLSASKTYYSRESEEQLGELLANKGKLNSYLKKLSSQMGQASPEVQKNYEILMILLQQLSQADLQIHQDQNGLQIYFNREQLAEKQREVERLQKELQQKNRQTEKIIEEYQGVIRNFNDVIERLILEKKH